MKHISPIQEKLIFRHLDPLNDVENVVDVLKQKMLKNPEGKYHDAPWLQSLIIQGHAMGGFINNKMVCCALGEDLIDKGVMIWFIAVAKEKQSLGYGSLMMEAFEEHLKALKKEWIFLNASANALDFYEKFDYSTTKTPTFEHIKML